jgi:hypothetical protein
MWSRLVKSWPKLLKMAKIAKYWPKLAQNDEILIKIAENW